MSKQSTSPVVSPPKTVSLRRRPRTGRRGLPPRPHFVPPGHLWLIDAIAEMGRAMMPNEWTGAELIAPLIRPELGDDAPWNHPELVEAGRVLSMKGNVVSQRFEVAPMPLADYRAERLPGLRFKTVVNRLRQHFWQGDLIAFTIEGQKPPIVVPSHAWQDENFFIMATQHGRHQRVGAGALFILTEDLRRLTASATQTPTAESLRRASVVPVEIAGEPKKKKPRTVPAEDRALTKNKIQNVLAIARRKWPDPAKRPTAGAMALELAKSSHQTWYDKGTIKQILLGIYPPAQKFEIKGI